MNRTHKPAAELPMAGTRPPPDPTRSHSHNPEARRLAAGKQRMYRIWQTLVDMLMRADHMLKGRCDLTGRA